MGELKKREFEDPINKKIQGKFDLVFNKLSGKERMANENKATALTLESVKNSDESAKLAQQNQNEKAPVPTLDLDSKTNNEVNAVPLEVLDENLTKLALVQDNEELTFGDEPPAFLAELPKSGTITQDEENKFNKMPSLEDINLQSNLDSTFDLELLNAIDLDFEGTQKTIIFDPRKLIEMDPLKIDIPKNSSSSIESMSTEEEKANIEMTIKDILQPKNFEATQDINLFELGLSNEFSDFSNHSDEAKRKGSDTPPLGFNLDDISLATSPSEEFDLNSFSFDEEKTEIINEKVNLENLSEFQNETEFKPEFQPGNEFIMGIEDDLSSNSHSSHAPQSSYISDDESTRVQATIRQMREEREILLGQLKNLKNENQELEQDNLTIKAALDESRIEVSILRKRHLIELEDIKYRFSLNEERKIMAEEKARQAEGKREKLEQKIRIDFNQVKQREKELETKLEMLTIDVSLQVQSRDSKILELRRKIDSLEFNMENVSIREQKSQDEKRKLEDKLSKMMKTLRHSIKNLEDDIDQVSDNSQDERQSIGHRSGKV